MRDLHLVTKLGWLQFCLRRYHSIDWSVDSIWSRIYADAGRSVLVAMEMVDELGGNEDALSSFAESLRDDPEPVPSFGAGFDPVKFGIVLGIVLVGLLIGGVL